MAKQTINNGETGLVVRTKINDNFNEVYSGVQLDTIATPPTYQAGRYWFDGVNFNFYDNVPGTSLQLGKELVVDAYNDNGSTINNFEVVRYHDANQGYPTMQRAQADTVDNCNLVAVATHDVLVGELGKVLYLGVAGGDTTAWADDDILYVSATVPGQLTNVEQPILSPVARVLVGGSVDGKILVSPKGVINITAIGQAIGIDNVQVLDDTPTPLAMYDISTFALNTTITQSGADPYTAQLSPASIGASGFYRIAFTLSFDSTEREIHHFELYIDGSPTGLESSVDMSGKDVGTGNASFNAITQTQLTDSSILEVYGWEEGGGGSTVTAAAIVFNIERIGNV